MTSRCAKLLSYVAIFAGAGCAQDYSYTPTPPVPPPPECVAERPITFAGLRVEGNHIVDAAGQEVRLRGVNRSGSEYRCVEHKSIFDGPVDDAAILAMVNWHINSVRIPLNEDCWLGINGVN